MKSAVVTGPTGSIGVALIKNLIKNQVLVYAVCHRGSSRISNIPESELVKVIYCDLSELTHLPEMIDGQVEIFYHLGWDGTFGNSRNNAAGQVANIAYTLDAVNAAAALGCKVFVGAGSQAEYGRVDGVLKPDTPCFPENGYGIAKLCAGQMSRLLAQQKKIRHIWVRILSVYGPCDGKNSLIMSEIYQLLDHHSPAFTKGEQQWDYLFSSDAGRALYLLALTGRDGNVYCLGGGKARMLKDYIQDVGNQIDPTVALDFGAIPYSSNQVMHLCADISDLTNDTGFIPEYSFEQGIAETIEWCKNHR